MGAEVSKAALSAEEEQRCRQKGRDEVLQVFKDRTAKHVVARADTPVQASVAASCRSPSSSHVVHQNVTSTTTQDTPQCETNTKRKASDSDELERQNKAIKISGEALAIDRGPSNLRLDCDDKAWHVHREVVLRASLPLFRAYMQSNDQSMVCIKDAPPAGVHAMLNFLYNGDYCAEQYCQTGESYPIQLHVMVYSLATTYEIGPLAFAAFGKFSTMLEEDPNLPGLHKVMLEILRDNPHRMEPLQMALLASMEKLRPVRSCSGNGSTLRPHPMLEAARKDYDRLLEPLQGTNSSTSVPPGISTNAIPAVVVSAGGVSYRTRIAAQAPGASRLAPSGPSRPGPTNKQAPILVHTSAPAGATTAWPQGDIEYLCRACGSVFKAGVVKRFSVSMFACPNCKVTRKGIFWDSVRKPRNFRGF
ncbi:hypothetical protein TI39_contig5841g00025 [Zymoseptoria brevis]|uniref:BTB domain-containing protein n=1 Tax=Zymoseptoria brevis TaxID=1047168 RepID=A0A0F4G5B4_9PEZI|nr:hypothetical protein TI39_contig5841g00025 [Zymoseptoria brevis]